MGLRERLLEQALRLNRQFGWSVIPVIGKKAVSTWKQYQQRPPTPKELHQLFAIECVTGLAVIHGAVSGGLVCRDFDSQAAYAAWKQRFPKTAKRLPTARTRRGFHVYFLGPEGYDEYPDGEYRGDFKHYTVLPPSGYPGAGFYEWRVEPSGVIPTVDPGKKGLRGKSKRTKAGNPTQCTKRTQEVGVCAGGTMSTAGTTSAVWGHQVDPTDPEVDHAIQATVPTATGKRHLLVFRLARRLKGIPAYRNLPGTAFHRVVQEWHKLSLPAIATKDFADTWTDFLQGWERVTQPDGEGELDRLYERALKAKPPPELVERYGEGSKAVRLALLCRELQERASDEPFFLDCRNAGRLLGTDHSSAAALLRLLGIERVIQLVTRGEFGRAASTYRYVFRPQAKRTAGRRRSRGRRSAADKRGQ